VVAPAAAPGLDAGPGPWGQPAVFYVAVTMPCIIGVLFATALTSFFKIEKPQRVTIAVECCYQNVGIAQSLAISMFTGPDLSIAIAIPLLYGIIEALVLGLYCIVCWKAGWTVSPSERERSEHKEEVR
jgi:predicted Na+-dependent transporter